MNISILPKEVINIIYEYVIYVPESSKDLKILVDLWISDKKKNL